MKSKVKVLNYLLLVLNTVPLIVFVIGIGVIVHALLQDSEGGGWGLFILFFMVPLVFIPLALQEAFSIITMVLSKNQKYKSAMVGSIGAGITSFFVAIAICFFYQDYLRESAEARYFYGALGLISYFVLSCILAIIITICLIGCNKQKKLRED